MRGQAEGRGVPRAPRGPRTSATRPDVSRLLHELSEHQAELEQQNHALRDAQVELESSRMRYRELYDFAPVSYLTLAADGTILNANVTAQQFFRTQATELIGRRISGFVADEDAAKLARHRKAVLAGSEHKRCDLAMLIGDVRREVRLESVRTTSSLEWRTALFDLTDLRQFEHLANERAFLSTVLDTAGLLVVLDPYGRISRPNAGCVRLVGDPSLMAGAYFWDVFATPETRAQCRRRFEAFVRSEEAGDWEGPVPARQGAVERIVAWRSALLRDAQGRVEHVITSGTDLTDRRMLEAQLLVADRLAAMGTLAAGVGHEINNPLAYTMLSLERAAKMVRRAEGPLPSSCAGLLPMLETAHEGAERIRCIVEDLRSLTAKSHGTSENVDIHSVLDSCARVAENQIRYRARLIREYRASRTVRADQTRLSQVFLNVLLNAAEAIPEGHPAANTIRIRTRDHGADRVVIEVQDSGSGIDPRLLQRIFDPFFTTKDHGTGLGLSICHEIITRMGGTIAANSAPGRSTEFRIELLASGEVTTAHAPAGPGLPAAPREAALPIDILIVDDEAQLATSIASLLPEHRVKIASSAKTALEMCESSEFDLILCDVLMPDGNGTDVLEALAKTRPGWEQRIVFMTGGAFTTRTSDALSRLPNRVLQKPFALEELLDVVAGAAQRAQRSAPPRPPSA